MAAGPAVGDTAPEFELDSTQGMVRLSEKLSHGAVLLVFYPGDGTPVCTNQLCDYRDNLGVFSKLGVHVVAINSQPLSSHENFAKAHELPFPLLSDPDRKTCKLYGASGLFGMTKRSLFLIRADGTVLYRQTDLPIFRRRAAGLELIISERLKR